MQSDLHSRRHPGHARPDYENVARLGFSLSLSRGIASFLKGFDISSGTLKRIRHRPKNAHTCHSRTRDSVDLDVLLSNYPLDNAFNGSILDDRTIVRSVNEDSCNLFSIKRDVCSNIAPHPLGHT